MADDMSGVSWAVTLHYQTPAGQNTIEGWDSSLEGRGASVSAVPGVGFTVTGYEDGPDPLKAAAMVRDYVGVVVSLDPTGIEILTEDEYIRRAVSDD